MKWSGGPVVAEAVVAGFRQFTNCSAPELRLAVAGFALRDLEESWPSRPPHFEAMAIYLKDQEWLGEPLAVIWIITGAGPQRRDSALAISALAAPK
jgi:hypothetical protein